MVWILPIRESHLSWLWSLFHFWFLFQILLHYLLFSFWSIVRNLLHLFPYIFIPFLLFISQILFLHFLKLLVNTFFLIQVFQLLLFLFIFLFPLKVFHLHLEFFPVLSFIPFFSIELLFSNVWEHVTWSHVNHLQLRGRVGLCSVPRVIKSRVHHSWSFYLPCWRRNIWDVMLRWVEVRNSVCKVLPCGYHCPILISEGSTCSLFSKSEKSINVCQHFIIFFFSLLLLFLFPLLFLKDLLM